MKKIIFKVTPLIVVIKKQILFKFQILKLLIIVW
jgi:hypothetical protein